MPKSPTSRSTIGHDPFGAVIPVQETERIAAPRRAARPTPVAAPESPDAVANRDAPAAPLVAVSVPAATPAAGRVAPKRKQKLTVHLDDDLLNRVKNAAYWNPRLTIARIAEQGIRQAIAQVEKENGGPYPQRESELIGGRPMK